VRPVIGVVDHRQGAFHHQSVWSWMLLTAGGVSPVTAGKAGGLSCTFSGR